MGCCCSRSTKINPANAIDEIKGIHIVIIVSKLLHVYGFYYYWVVCKQILCPYFDVVYHSGRAKISTFYKICWLIIKSAYPLCRKPCAVVHDVALLVALRFDSHITSTTIQGLRSIQRTIFYMLRSIVFCCVLMCRVRCSSNVVNSHESRSRGCIGWYFRFVLFCYRPLFVLCGLIKLCFHLQIKNIRIIHHHLKLMSP